MGIDIKFRRGQKIKLPDSAPSGMPLWCEDTCELYMGTGDNVEKIGSQADFATQALQDASGNEISTTYDKVHKEINLLPSSGTIELQDNSINRIERAMGKVTFVLPEVNDDKFHQILIQFHSMLAIVDLGTEHFFNNESPTLTIGTYDIIYEHDGTNWVVGAVKKGIESTTTE